MLDPKGIGGWSGSAGGGSPMGGADMSFGQMYGMSAGFTALTKGLKAYTESAAQKSYYLRKAAISQRNAELVQMQIDDQKKVSKKEQAALRRKYTNIKKSQLTEFAGRNILLGGGSPLDALLGTEVVETADIGILKQNEARAVFGLKISKYNAQSDAALFSGSASRISPGFDFASTMLSSAGSSYMGYQTWKNTPVTGSRTSMKRALGIS